MADVSHRGRRNTVGLNVDATDYGLATGASAAANTAALQRAIDIVNAAGRGEVFIPDGTYTFARYSTFGWCLLLKSGVTIVGESQTGVILKQAASMAASVRLFYATDAVRCGLDTMTLDGNKANQSVNEHRHGMFIDGASDVLIRNVTSQNFSGDGFYVYTDTSDLTFKACTATLNDRSGITIGRTCNDVEIRGCTLTLNAAQEIDFEPATTDDVHDVRIIGNTIGDPDGGDTDYTVAIGGTSSSGRTHDVVFKGNTVYGSVSVTWAYDVTITGNDITVAGSDTPCVFVYRNSSDIEITHNDLRLTRTFADAGEHAAVRIEATGADNQPENVTLSHNEITLSHPNTAGPTVGVLIRGAGTVTAEYNTVTGAGGTAGAGYDGGFLLRGNVAGGPYTIRYNTIRNIGTKGVLLYDAQTISALDVSYNDIDDTQATPTMTVGIDLYDSAENATTYTCIENTIGDAITTAIDYPPNVQVLTGYTHEGFPVYTGEATPTFSLDTIGAIYIKVNTSGVVTATYEKRSTGTSGWTLVN